MTARTIIALLASASLAACTTPRAGTGALPPAPIPASWPVGDAYLAQSEAGLPAVTNAEIFRDPRLQQIIAQALVNNRDLRVAAANVAAARAQVQVVRAAQLPQIGVNAGASVSSGGTNSGTDSGTESGGGRSQRFSIQGGVSSFELDFFGKYANATEAQRDRALSTEAAARTVRLGLVADIADAWATYAADRDLLAIAEATATNAAESVRLTDARRAGGIAPRTDLAQAQQILATAQLAIAQQKTALAQDANLLRLLVGAEVDPALLPASLAEIDPTFATLPAGLDSRVLLRRPDVVDAEYQLRAAEADIAVARAELFPAISLTGLLGVASSALASLFTGGAFSLTGGANASYAIFDGGARRANVAVTQAQRDAALATYEKAVQTAFREVADALADQGTLGEQQRAARANTAAAATTARLTEARYRNGIDSFLDSLVAQRSLYSARQQQVAIALGTIQNRITLYRVLGGDQLQP